MAENAVSLNGVVSSETNLHFSRSVLPILVYRLEQTGLEKLEDLSIPFLVISGTVIVSGSNFCYMITANKKLLVSSKYKFKILFPNNSIGDLEIINIQKQDELAGCFCPIPTGTVGIDKVQFSNQIALENQKLKMFGYDVTDAGQLQNILCHGFLTHVENQYFGHDCPPSRLSLYGSPVFNEVRELVGISYANKGVTNALNVGRITEILSGFFEGMDKKPISEILERIKVVGEEKFPKLGDPLT